MADDSWLDTLLNGATAALMPSPPTRHVFEDFVATPVDQAHQAWQGTLPADQYPAAGMSIAGLAALGSAPMGAAGAAEGMTVGAGARRAFNPSKLEALNPQNWDLSGVPDVPQGTVGTKVSKKVSERVADLTANQLVKDAMLNGIARGVEMGGHEWYNTSPLLNDFRTVRGAGEGDAAYGRFMDLAAATSPRSDVGTNIRNASYYFQRGEQGLGQPAIGDKNPQPYGHMAQRLHQMNAQKVAEGGGWDPIKNPKPTSFAANLQGNFEPVAVDTHAFRAPAIMSQDPRFLETRYQSTQDAPPRNIQQEVLSGQMPMEEAAANGAYWQSMPGPTEYTPMRDYYAQLGQEAGLAPAQAQAAAWTGMGGDTGLKSSATERFMDTFHNVIQRTAQKTGRAPEDVYLDFLRSNGDPLRPDLPAGTFFQGGAPVAPPQPTPYVYDPMGA